MLDTQPIYPATGAYVVQLRREARPEHDQWIGRIEHVETGASLEFATFDALVAWLCLHRGRVSSDSEA